MVAAADLPSGRLAFLFSDIEGSTRLLTDLGDRFTTLLVDHQRLVRSSLGANRGIEISTEGDSFFAVFRSALDAVIAAADVQRGLAAHAWPEGHELRVRVGVHLGQAVLAGDDYVGIDVNRAARIANAANGGQVVLSDEAAADVARASPPGLALLDLGRHRLRDIGVVRLWQLEIDGLPTRAAPLRTLEAHPTNLPIESVSFVDREAETEELRRLIAEGQLVTVTGPGGIGKSRLAVHAARGLVAGFPDGVFYLDLAPIDGLETLLGELAELLDVRMPPDGHATTALLEHLRDRRSLLVLETADRLPGIAELVARMIGECPATRMLVTARSPLHIRAERELSVRPLGLPGPRPDPASARASPAVELFLQRAQAVAPGFRLTETNVAAVSAIVERLDGIPLAIELAAAGVRLLSPAAILDRLERSMPLPGGAAIDAPERQRTLRDTIAWSYQLLEPDEQTLLQRLSVFVGDFDLVGIEAVALGDAMDVGGAPDPLETLGRLVDRNLVHRVESDDEDRYHLLGIIRDFAAGELESAGGLDAARSRHAHHWLEVASRLVERLSGPGELGASAALDRAGDEFRAAFQWALESDHAEHLALRLSSRLGRFWYLRGRMFEGAASLGRALDIDTDAPRELRAQALHWLGVMLDEQRDEAGAIERLEEALAIQRELGDEESIARELNSLGAVHRNIGDQERSRSLLMESLARRRRLGDQAGVATVLTNLGIVALDRGDPGSAIEPLEEALAIDRASGATGGTAYSSSALGTAYLRTGRREEAIDHLRSALVVFHDLEDTDGVAESLERLGEASAAEEPARAVRLLLAARSIRERERVGLRAIDAARATELIAGVTGSLSQVELDAAQADASAMDVDAAAAYALAVRA